MGVKLDDVARSDQYGPKVAIILVNWNGHEDTVACIESLRKTTYDNHEVVVVDNGSTKESLDYIRTRAPEVQVISLSSNTGFTGGNNAGVEKALEDAFDVFVLLNNDTLVEEGFLEPLVAELSRQEVGAVQPKILYLGDRKRIWNAGGKYNRRWALSITIGNGKLDTASFDEPADTDWITGCCLATRKDVFDAVGLLDDNFFAYHEDVDLSLRMRAAGYKLRYEPTSVIYHSVSQASKSTQKGKEGFVSPYVHFLNVRNRLYLIRKHYDGLSIVPPYVYQLIWVMALMTYFLVRGRRNKALSSFRGFVEGHRLECRS